MIVATCSAFGGPAWASLCLTNPDACGPTPRPAPVAFNLVPCQNPQGANATGTAKVTISEQNSGWVSISTTVSSDMPDAGSLVSFFDYSRGADLGNPNGTNWFTLQARGSGQVSWSGQWPGGPGNMPSASDDVALLSGATGWSIMQTWAGPCFGPLG